MLSNYDAQHVTFEQSGHVAIVHTDCQQNYCQFCAGGLFGCVRCGSYEGATTTHCPGWDIRGLADAIYSGKLDYRDGEWFEIGSPHTPNRGWDLYLDGGTMP